MGDTTGIGWCDSTFNPWIGCARVSEGCKFCYAERENKVYRWNGGEWGRGAPRKRTSESNWKKPLTWNRQAEKRGVRQRVFCASLADVFDEEAPEEWRRDLFGLILETPHLDWLVLTKRAEAMRDYMRLWQTEHGERQVGRVLNYNWPLPNLWLGVSAENQKRADERIPILLSIPAVIRFVSIEPMLGPVDLLGKEPDSGYLSRQGIAPDGKPAYSPGLDWVICGGESGPNARPMNIEWARSLQNQCKNVGVAFFFKQLGGHPDKRDSLEDLPGDMRIRQFPDVNS